MSNEKQLDIVQLKLPADLKIRERGRQILALHFEHPDWSYQQLADTMGVSKTRISQILNHPKVLAAMPHIGKQRVKSMIPKAIKRYSELIDHENAIVSERASSTVLKQNGVFDAPDQTVKVDITSKSVTELRSIVEKANELPRNVLDAEVVDDQVA